MGTVLLRQATPAANTETALYTVTTAKQGIVDINACNKGATASAIRIVVISGATRTYLEYGLSLTAAGTEASTLERAGRKYPAGTQIAVWADSANVDFTAEAVEE